MRPSGPAGKWISLAVLAYIGLFCSTGCNIEDTSSIAGESCDDPGAEDGNLVCENGEWKQKENDGSNLDAGDFDAEESDADASCEAESDREFCERHDAVCGEIAADDNCGVERTVDCVSVEGLGCGLNEACDEGACSCPDGYTECGDGECVDTTSNPDYCGGCDTSCATEQVCSEGGCIEECPAGETDCSGTCTDTDTDANNCNGCGNDCTEDDGWYDDGDPYDCCNDGDACTCQDQN